MDVLAIPSPTVIDEEISCWNIDDFLPTQLVLLSSLSSAPFPIQWCSALRPKFIEVMGCMYGPLLNSCIQKQFSLPSLIVLTNELREGRKELLIAWRTEWRKGESEILSLY